MEIMHPWRAPNDRRSFSLFFMGMGTAAFFIIAFFILILFPEQYFTPAPAIGTTFAKGYDEARFDQIQPGMSRDEVIALLGDPLEKMTLVGGGMMVALEQGERNTSMPAGSAEMWSYSQDGGIGIWDFAWLGRYVYFDDAGKVTGTLEWVYYD